MMSYTATKNELATALSLVLAAWAKNSTTTNPIEVGVAMADSEFESVEEETSRSEWNSDAYDWNLPRADEFSEEDQDNCEQVIDALSLACHRAASEAWEKFWDAR